MSKTFEFENTSIISQFNMDLVNMGYIWVEERTANFYKTLFDSIAHYLKYYQSKNDEKVVFKLKDEKGDFKFGAALIYQKPEEDSEEDSGNWYLQFTFNEEDLADASREIDNLSDAFYTVMAE